MKEWLIVIVVLLMIGVVLDAIRRMRIARRNGIRLSRNAKKADREFDQPESHSEFPSGGARVVSYREEDEANNLNQSVKQSLAAKYKTVGAPQRMPESEGLHLGSAELGGSELRNSVPMLMDPVDAEHENAPSYPASSHTHIYEERDHASEPNEEDRDYAYAESSDVDDDDRYYVTPREEPVGQDDSHQNSADEDVHSMMDDAPYGEEDDHDMAAHDGRAAAHAYDDDDFFNDGQPIAYRSPIADDDDDIVYGRAQSHYAPAEPTVGAVKEASAIYDTGSASDRRQYPHEQYTHERYDAQRDEKENDDALAFGSSSAHQETSHSQYERYEAPAEPYANANNYEPPQDVSSYGDYTGYEHDDVDDSDDDDDEEIIYQEPDEVIIMNIMAKPGTRFHGEDLLNALMAEKLKLGAMDIFHRHLRNDGDAPVIFSLANMVVPGTFNLAEMRSFETPGVSLFLSLPVSGGESIAAYDDLARTARNLADALHGDLKDENRSVMTRQTIEHGRQRVIEYERRKKLARV